MARPDALVPGNCYFLLQFHDQDLLFPDVTTLTYVGAEESDDGRRMWVFHEPPSADPAKAESEEENPAFFAFGDDDVHQILDFAGLLRALGEIAVDHPIRPPAPPSPRVSSDAPFAELPAQLAAFIANPEMVGLTITILFTDEGLSFNRGRDGMEVSFFLAARLEAAQEAQIRALFEKLGCAPRADDLSAGGRTRILSFPIAERVDDMAALCRRVLADVYSMRETDRLRFSPLTRRDVEQQT